MLAWTHPDPVKHLSDVHASESLHEMSAWTHPTPAMHESSVQGSSSLQFTAA
jgi:hypothetical protein